MVIGDDVVIDPATEAAALFAPHAVIILPRLDSADVVLDSVEEVSIRWHPLTATSPNINASVQVVAGDLPRADIVAAAESNRTQPDEHRLLDAFVRDAVTPGNPSAGPMTGMQSWPYNGCASRWPRCGQRDHLRPDPNDPAGALTAVIAEATRHFDF